jgi:hypothetical protein
MPVVLYGCEIWSLTLRKNVYGLWVGKPGGKRPLARSKRVCVDNIRMDLGEIGYGGMD